jgi:Na+-driven multidrug efflux pump
MSGSLDGAQLTSPRLLARNVALNALGWLLPMLLALGAIPVLVRALGPARFGVLSLVWTLVGYFSLFDLGLGRALTQLVAERLGRDERDQLPGLVWTATWLLVPLGIVGGAAVALLAPWLVERVLRVPPALRPESVAAFRWIGLAVPFTVSTAGFRGVLEAVQAFRRINALRVPLALITFVGPLLVLPFSRSLAPSVAVLAVGRVVLWAAHVHASRQAFEPLRRARAPERHHLRPLLSVGGWMTVSNVVSPLMYSLDRFAVAALLSVTAVSYYATAYEAVTRLWVVTSILLPVLFPAMGVALQRDRAHAALLLDRGARATLGAVFPAALALSAFAPGVADGVARPGVRRQRGRAGAGARGGGVRERRRADGVHGAPGQRARRRHRPPAPARAASVPGRALAAAAGRGDDRRGDRVGASGPRRHGPPAARGVRGPARVRGGAPPARLAHGGRRAARARAGLDPDGRRADRVRRADPRRVRRLRGDAPRRARRARDARPRRAARARRPRAGGRRRRLTRRAVSARGTGTPPGRRRRARWRARPAIGRAASRATRPGRPRSPAARRARTARSPQNWMAVES